MAAYHDNRAVAAVPDTTTLRTFAATSEHADSRLCSRDALGSIIQANYPLHSRRGSNSSRLPGDELITMVAQAKGSYQAPKSVEFVDAIPQTPVGKPDKKALRLQCSG